MRESVYSIIREALELPESFQIHDSLVTGDVPGWDSLGWISVITFIEERCEITFPLEELARVVTIGDLCRIVEQKEN